MIVIEYFTKFEETNLTCDVKEEQSLLLSRFRMGLRPEIRRKLLHHRATSLADMYEKAVDLEQYVKLPFPKGQICTTLILGLIPLVRNLVQETLIGEGHPEILRGTPKERALLLTMQRKPFKSSVPSVMGMGILPLRVPLYVSH